jgi:hypothetical protein
MLATVKSVTPKCGFRKVEVTVIGFLRNKEFKGWGSRGGVKGVYPFLTEQGVNSFAVRD